MTEFISIRGARENNLKDVTLRIPKRKLTIFTGVSGSGKSSIVFDTLATEAQRQLYENFSLFIRNFLPKYPQPDADAIENLTMAVIVDQKRLGGGSHSTVGTVTDIYGVLRLLFSRVGKPSAGMAVAYSFNDPRGACAECGGLGKKVGVVSDDFLDMNKSLNEGAIQGCRSSANGTHRAYTLSGFFDNGTRSSANSRRMKWICCSQLARIRSSRPGSVTAPSNLTYAGIIARIESATISTTRYQDAQRTHAESGDAISQTARMSVVQRRAAQCGRACEQNQRPQHRGSVVDGTRRALEGGARDQRTRRPSRSCVRLWSGFRRPSISELEYLRLNRETDTLSGGESQRVRMVKHLGSSLVDVMYIFDEPSVGLRSRTPAGRASS